MDKDYIKDILQHFRQANSKVKDSLAVVVMATAFIYRLSTKYNIKQTIKAKGK